MIDAPPKSVEPSRPSREEKLRARAVARKERMRRRAGRADGERPGPIQLAREYWRAAVLRVGKDNRKRFNRVLAKYSRVGDPSVFDPAVFPFVGELERNWEVIRREAELVMEARDQLPALNQLSPDHDRINTDGRWKAFIIYGYGYPTELGLAKCPETAKLVKRIPNLWSAFFSILTPGTHLIPHRGPTKAIVTWHLGLKVPKDRDRCWIRVADETYTWEEGKSFVFDDAHKHEVRNDTDEERVVLLLHFRRPVRFPGSLVGRAILTAIRWSPFIRDARRNHTNWERAFVAAVEAREPEANAPGATDAPRASGSSAGPPSPSASPPA